MPTRRSSSVALARGRHRDPFVDVQRLGDLPAHRLDGIERAHRVLEDHRDPAAAQRLHVRARQAREIAVAESHRAAEQPAAFGQKPEYREAGDGLARPALSYEAECASLAHLQIDAVHRHDRAGAVRRVEAYAQRRHREKHRRGARLRDGRGGRARTWVRVDVSDHRRLGSRRSRSQSPRMETDSVIRKIVKPGATAIHGACRR